MLFSGKFKDSTSIRSRSLPSKSFPILQSYHHVALYSVNNNSTVPSPPPHHPESVTDIATKVPFKSWLLKYLL
jgi:hypothetical protein